MILHLSFTVYIIMYKGIFPSSICGLVHSAWFSALQISCAIIIIIRVFYQVYIQVKSNHKSESCIS